MKKNTSKPERLMRRHDASETLLDEDFIFRAFLDCLKDDDFQAAVDVLKSYARVNTRVKATKRAKPKAALYQRFASRGSN